MRAFVMPDVVAAAAAWLYDALTIMHGPFRVDVRYLSRETDKISYETRRAYRVQFVAVAHVLLAVYYYKFLQTSPKVVASRHT